MERKYLKIGQKVRIVPNHTNKDLPAPKESTGYVRELHNNLVAGISRRPTGIDILSSLKETRFYFQT